MVIPLHGGARSNPRPGSVRDNRWITKCTKGGCKLANTLRMSGADFNVEQVEGLPSRYCAQAQVRPDPVERIERADAFFAATQAGIRHGGNMAYYNVSADHVQMPPFERFGDAESY